METGILCLISDSPPSLHLAKTHQNLLSSSLRNLSTKTFSRLISKKLGKPLSQLPSVNRGLRILNFSGSLLVEANLLCSRIPRVSDSSSSLGNPDEKSPSYIPYGIKGIGVLSFFEFSSRRGKTFFALESSPHLKSHQPSEVQNPHQTTGIITSF